MYGNLYQTPLGELTERKIITSFPYPDSLLYCVLTPEQLAERTANCEDSRAAADIAATLAYVLAQLSDRERRVIALRFERRLTLQQCGAELGITQERVRQIEAKSLRKLRHPARCRYLVNGVLGCANLRYQAGYDAGVREGREQIAREYELGQQPAQTEQMIRSCHIAELGLSVRAYNVLTRAAITDAYQIAKMTRKQLSQLRNCGKKTAEEIIDVMFTKFGVNIPEE